MTFLRTVVLLSFCGINCAAAAQDIKDLTAQEREYLGFLAGGHCRSIVKTSGTFEKEPMDKMITYWRVLLAQNGQEKACHMLFTEGVIAEPGSSSYLIGRKPWYAIWEWAPIRYVLAWVKSLIS